VKWIPFSRQSILRDTLKEEIVTDELLAGYALGRLSGEEQERVEARMFEDKEILERLRVVEDELIDAYASGGLTEDERSRFQKYFLQSHADKERVEFARELAALASRRALSPRAKESPARRAHWSELLHIRNPWALVPLAAAVLIAIGALWLIFQTMRLNDRLELIQAQRDVQEKREQELEQQVAEERRRSQQLSEELERVRARQGIEEPTEPAPEPSARSFVSFILTPGAVRDRSSAPKLAIPSDSKQVRLQALFKTGGYRGYSAELQTVEGRVLWQRAGLTARKLRDHSSISVIVPASLFGDNDYILILKGVTSAGEESVGEYFFKVSREQSR
jgi:hypothetical protein